MIRIKSQYYKSEILSWISKLSILIKKLSNSQNLYLQSFVLFDHIFLLYNHSLSLIQCSWRPNKAYSIFCWTSFFGIQVPKLIELKLNNLLIWTKILVKTFFLIMTTFTNLHWYESWFNYWFLLLKEIIKSCLNL